MSFLDILAVRLFRRFPALETRLTDGAFETCTRTFQPPSPAASLPSTKFIFFHTLIFPALIAPSQYRSVWCWQWFLLMTFFPLWLPAMETEMFPSQFEHTKGWAAVSIVQSVASASSRATTGSHDCVKIGAIQAACKYIQITEGSRHRDSFSVSPVPPVMLPLPGGWNVFVWVTQV